MLQFSEELGPLEVGYKRLAFIFTCIDRYRTIAHEETKQFAKFFPDVHLYGIWSLGEFCMGYKNLPQKCQKKGKLI